MLRLLPLLPLLCAATFETGDSEPYPHESFSDKQLARSLKKANRASGIEEILVRDERGETQAKKTRELPRVGLSALLRVHGLSPAKDTVYRLLVPAEDDRIAIVVTWEPPRAVVEVGVALEPLHADQDAISVVVLDQDGAVWDGAAWGLLADALSRLTDVELKRIEGLRVVRMEAPPPGVRAQIEGDGRLVALYDQRDDQSSLILTNYAVQGNLGSFCGPAADPRPTSLHTVLHELGHAVHQGRFRARLQEIRALESAFPTPEGKTREAIGRHMALTKEHKSEEVSPVIAAWKAQFDSSPTEYGNTSAPEAFAEAFALYHLDPQALHRAMPDAHAWFESDYDP